MATLDAVTVAQLARKLGLVTAEQINEGWQELGQRGGAAEPFLRVLEKKGYLTPYQSARLAKGEQDGYFIGGYRLLYRISSGSFGRVYRAEDTKTGVVVAIKVLKRKWSEDRHTVDLFVREGTVGMSMHHANLVEILKVDKDEATGQHYIVMEFVEGGNLRDFLAIRKKLEPAEALRILEDSTSALAYAYSRGVSHRDMKLTNILISSQGHAKVVDFGLAGGSYQAADKNDPLQVERTVDYAGLEEATGVQPGDIRSDIFFLGCVFFELLTGRPPLEMTRDARSRMRKDRFTSVKPIHKDEVNGPPALFRLIETMMSIDAQQRYQTPAQLLEAIKGVRREIDGKGNSQPATSHTIFIVEKDERLKDAMRDKFKELASRCSLPPTLAAPWTASSSSASTR